MVTAGLLFATEIVKKINIKKENKNQKNHIINQIIVKDCNDSTINIHLNNKE